VVNIKVLFELSKVFDIASHKIVKKLLTWNATMDQIFKTNED